MRRKPHLVPPAQGPLLKMEGPTNILLDINGRTDTKTDFPVGVCSGCKSKKSLLLVSFVSNRFYCSEACLVKTERSGE